MLDDFEYPPFLIIGGSVLNGDGLFELLDRTHDILNKNTICQPQRLQITEIDANDDNDNNNNIEIEEKSGGENIIYSIDEDVGNWLERIQKQDNDTFIEQIKTLTLNEDFDHYNFVRLIWICFKQNDGDYNRGLNEILELISKFKNEEYNVTLIYFWCQMIYYSLHRHQDNQLKQKISIDFTSFIAINPTLCNSSNLLKEYYSEQLLFKTMEKPTQFFMPDIKSLPSLITDIATLKQEKKGKKIKIKKKEEILNDIKLIQHGRNVNFFNHEDDKIFLAQFEQRKLTEWNHILFLRVIWCYLTYYQRSHAIDVICKELKEYEKEKYHETLTYFWIHIIEYFKVLSQQNNKNATFIQFYSILAINDWSINNSLKYDLSDINLWKQFYSQNVMHQKGYQGIDAKKQLCLPDKKSIPSAVCYFVYQNDNQKK